MASSEKMQFFSRWLKRRRQRHNQQSLSLVDSKQPRLGEYILIQSLGESVQGKLWLARRDLGQRRFVVKAARAGKSDRAAQAALLREAEILELIGGRGAPRYYAQGDDAEFGVYFVMDYIEGRALDAFLVQADGWRRFAVLRRLVERIAHFHDMGIAHRDLREDNIIVDATDHPKVLDFGSARLASASSNEQQRAFLNACRDDFGVLWQWARELADREDLPKGMRRRLRWMIDKPIMQPADLEQLRRQLERLAERRRLGGEMRWRMRQLMLSSAVTIVVAGVIVGVWLWL